MNASNALLDGFAQIIAALKLNARLVPSVVKVFLTSLLNQRSVEQDISVKLEVMFNLSVPLAILMHHLDQLNVLSAQ